MRETSNENERCLRLGFGRGRFGCGSGCCCRRCCFSSAGYLLRGVEVLLAQSTLQHGLAVGARIRFAKTQRFKNLIHTLKIATRDFYRQSVCVSNIQYAPDASTDIAKLCPYNAETLAFQP